MNLPPRFVASGGDVVDQTVPGAARYLDDLDAERLADRWTEKAATYKADGDLYRAAVCSRDAVALYRAIRAARQFTTRHRRNPLKGA